MTDRCNIRCVYCMPETVESMPRANLLSFEEIERFVRVAVSLGIDKIRLTGGEPPGPPRLTPPGRSARRNPRAQRHRPDNQRLVARPDGGRAWDAGLRRINVSLDTMDPAKFLTLTCRTGSSMSSKAVWPPRPWVSRSVKINAIAIKGVTEEDTVPLALLRPRPRSRIAVHRVHAVGRGQPPGTGQGPASAAEILELLTRGHRPPKPAPNQDPRVPAVDHDYEDGRGRVG